MSSSRSHSSLSTSTEGGVRTPIKSRVTPGASRLPIQATSSPTSKKTDSPRPVASTASPQVRARLAELRKATKQAQATNNALRTPDASRTTGDDWSSIATSRRSDSPSSFLSREDATARPTSRASLRTMNVGDDENGAAPSLPAFGEVPVEFGMRSLNEVVQKAKTSGRLNVASRSLTEMPIQVYDQLIPRGSMYHPSATKASATALSTAFVDLSISSPHTEDDDPAVEGSGPKWWEIADLTVLKASNNELESVDDWLAGFEQLQVVDLHNNRIQSLPASFGTLVNLTSLNLAGNAIKQFPIELMALVHLKELDLSGNGLTSLWGREWRTSLKTRLSEVSRKRRKGLVDPDSSFDSLESQSTASPDRSGTNDFWSGFTSSPIKPREPAYARTAITTDFSQPLPSLITLSLRDNNLRAAALSVTNVLQLPPSLVSLDLANNGLSGKIPFESFATLPSLKTLDLSSNGLDDDFFAATLNGVDPPSPAHAFPSLTTLNIAKNAIDDLNHLETCLGIGVHRKAEYAGIVSVSLRRYITAAQVEQADATSATDLPELTIDIRDNFLRKELDRRKKKRRPERQDPTPQPSEVSRSQESPSEKNKVELEALFRDVSRFLDAIAGNINTPDVVNEGEMAEIRDVVAPLRAYVASLDAKKQEEEKGTTSRSDREVQPQGQRKAQEKEYVWGPL